MITLHIITDYYGTSLYRKLLDSLSLLGIENLVFVPIPKGRTVPEAPDVLSVSCFNRIDRLLYFTKQKKVLRALEERIDLSSIDICHAHTLFSSGYVAMKLKEEYGIPYIVAVRNVDVNTFLKKMPHLRRIGQRIIQGADKLVFISPSYYDYIAHTFPILKENGTLSTKSVVIPNGISELFLDAKPTSLQETSSTYDGRIDIIQAGDIDKNKNQLAVIRAKRILEQQGYKVRFLVVGRAVDQQIVRSLKNEPGVVVKDPVSQNELLQLYRASDVFVMPSKYETFGLSYIEAMSQGLPVIYTRGQGIDGYFPEGYVGYAVAFGNDPQLANCILQAYKEKDKLGKHAIEEASRFDWNLLAKRYVELYKTSCSI